MWNRLTSKLRDPPRLPAFASPNVDLRCILPHLACKSVFPARVGQCTLFVPGAQRPEGLKSPEIGVTDVWVPGTKPGFPARAFSTPHR